MQIKSEDSKDILGKQKRSKDKCRTVRNGDQAIKNSPNDNVALNMVIVLTCPTLSKPAQIREMYDKLVNACQDAPKITGRLSREIEDNTVLSGISY